MSLQSYYYDYLTHHGIKGQKWGVRRFENEDGSLTPAGKARYADYDGPLSRKKRKVVRDLRTKERKALQAATKAGDKADRADEKGRWRRAVKYDRQAKKYDAEADRYDKKIQTIRRRAEKWAQSKARISDIGAATVSYGKEAVNKAVYKMTSPIRKANSAIDRYIANAPNNRAQG